MGTLACLLPVTLAAIAWGLWKSRHDYRKHGRCTAFGFISVLFMFFMPQLMLDRAIVYAWPDSPLDYAGLAVCVVMWTLCLVACVDFRSARKVLCLDAGQLTVRGLYRFSRNPQYVGWGVGVIGYAVTGWTVQCLIGLGLFAVMVHLFILIEEEHLRRTFGEEFTAFCRKVPRYIGLGPVRI